MSKRIYALALLSAIAVTACQDPSQPTAATTDLRPSMAVFTGTHIYAAGNHTCAIGEFVRFYCWGRNAEGQVGNNTTGDPYTAPELIRMPPGVGQFYSMDGGWNHTCGLDPNGVGYCWGDNAEGQLGTNTTIARPRPAPIRMPAGTAFFEVSGGQWNHTCAVANTGMIYCWGDNTYRQLGTTNANDRLQPTAVRLTAATAGATFTRVAGGFFHTCALAAGGDAYCWGMNDTGRLGVGTNLATRPYPLRVKMPVDVGFYDIAAGRDHTCALSTGGVAYCWGSNLNGQVGNNNQNGLDYPTPRRVRMPNGVTFTDLTAGWDHTCALGNDSKVYCWGNNLSGGLGVGDNNPRFLPRPVLGALAFTKVTARYNHTCGIAGGNMYCWGSNTNGELGTGDQFNKLVPTPVES